MSVCTNIFQQVFCLSATVCAAAPLHGDVAFLQDQLAAKLNSLLTNPDFTNGDDWSLVWGPAVWQSLGSTVIDQAAAVSYNSTAKTYVVSIAATNPNSPFDIFLEDLAVPPSFMQPLPAGGTISYGNNVALLALQGLNDPVTQASLADFLSSVATSAASVVFAGHSLGGGLAPILALALYPTGTTGSHWGNVYVYPSAGPTTGNAAFASAFKAAYPVVTVTSGTYQMWNANQFNTRDIVPNAWATGTAAPSLDHITAGGSDAKKHMFVTSVAMKVVVTALCDMAKALVGSGGASPYTAINVNPMFTGALQHAKISTQAELAAEILYQHTTAYGEAFGVTALSGTTLATAIKPSLTSLITEPMAEAG